MKIIKIYGPPGTGKTTTCLSMLEKELRDGLPITDISYLTHTRPAAEEVRSRTFEQFSGVLKKDLLWFRTIHGACCKIMGITGAETIGAAALNMFRDRYGYQIDGKHWSDMSHNERSWDHVLEARSAAASKMSDIKKELADRNIRESDYEGFIDSWTEFKESIGMVDYLDQLLNYDGRPLPVKVMFIDEAQDLSKLQWKIVKEMASGCDRLYVAGDDDQSIFGFIGADEYGFLNLEADEEILLSKSYRVPKIIGNFAEKIINQNERRKHKEIIWNDYEGSITRVGGLSGVDFSKETFILARHNKQCRDVSKVLKSWGVPHSVNGESLQQSPIAYVTKTYFDLLIEEDVTPGDAAKLADHLGLVDLAKEIRKYRKLGRKKISYDMMHGVNFDADWQDYLSRGNAKNREDLRALADVFTDAKGYSDVVGTPPRVSVMTYHYSKGREADQVVCLLDCYEAVWKELQNHSQSEVRLCYVAATRAKKDLVIVFPDTRKHLTPLLENF